MFIDVFEYYSLLAEKSVSPFVPMILVKGEQTFEDYINKSMDVCIDIRNIKANGTGVNLKKKEDVRRDTIFEINYNFEGKQTTNCFVIDRRKSARFEMLLNLSHYQANSNIKIETKEVVIKIINEFSTLTLASYDITKTQLESKYTPTQLASIRSLSQNFDTIDEDFINLFKIYKSD